MLDVKDPTFLRASFPSLPFLSQLAMSSFAGSTGRKMLLHIVHNCTASGTLVLCLLSCQLPHE